MSNAPLRCLSSALALLALAAFPLAGCEKDNPNFCGTGVACDPPDARPIDAVEGCTANPALCTADQTCLQPDNVCVDCSEGGNTESSQCAAATPVCTQQHTCRACAADTECDSHLCDHGTCVAAAAAMFVSPTGDDGAGNDCASSAAPCRTITHALTKVPDFVANPANRRFIRLMVIDSYVEPNALMIGDKAVVIIGAPPSGNDRSVIDRMGNGVTLDLTGTADVRLERLAVDNGVNTTAANGISCHDGATLVADNIEVDNNQGLGIVTNVCKLTLTNSIISRNNVGGLSIQGERVVIVNNVIAQNGGAASTFGGIQILGGVANTSIIQSNTVVGNQANTALQSDGVECFVTGLNVQNSIIFGTIDRYRVNGVCTYNNVVFGPSDNGGRLTAGTGNEMTAAEADLKFTDSAMRNYHIGPASTAKGKGTANGLADEAKTDLDGEARPQGAPDVGVDEIPD